MQARKEVTMATLHWSVAYRSVAIKRQYNTVCTYDKRNHKNVFMYAKI